MANVALTYGGYYFSTATATNNLAATPIKAAGTTTAYPLNGFTHTDNRLTYTGTTTRTFEVACTVSMSCSGATESKIYIYKNASLVTGSTVERKISTGGDIGAVAAVCLVSLAEDDYVELWCESDNDADDITVEAGSVLVKVVG